MTQNLSEPPPSAAEYPDAQTPNAWRGEMTRYHWIVMILCSLGGALDRFNQQIFAIGRVPAVAELLNLAEGAPAAGYWSVWATGGIHKAIFSEGIH